VEVTFEIDVSGVVKVTAREIYTGVEARVRIDASHLLPEDQIEARVREAVVQAASDRERRKTAEASIQAGVLLDAGKAFLDKKRFPTDERDTIQWALFDLENALAEGDIAGLEENMETLRGFLHNY
jgi:molecular chaperone DnaK (HSP70)